MNSLNVYTKNNRHIYRTEKGVALVMVLVLSAIALAIMAAVMYMIMLGTETSGIQKRYKTAYEAGIGGSTLAYQFISLRGESSGQAALITSLISMSASVPTDTQPIATRCKVSTAVDYNGTKCNVLFGNLTGLAAKLNSPTVCWENCDSSITITPGTTTTYDLTYNIGTGQTYKIYAKIIDTVAGNTGGDESLWKSGVVSANSGEVQAVAIPSLYTIEVLSQKEVNPDERSKLSVLYQY